MSAQFGERYRTKATIRIQYKPGDAIQMDWAGDAILIQDPATGEQTQLICNLTARVQKPLWTVLSTMLMRLWWMAESRCGSAEA